LEIIQSQWSTCKRGLNEIGRHRNCAFEKPIYNDFEWVLTPQGNNLSDLGGNLNLIKNSICPQIQVTTPLMINIIGSSSFYISKLGKSLVYLFFYIVEQLWFKIQVSPKREP